MTIDTPDDIGNRPASAATDDVSRIDFLRSTTTTIVDREADGDESRRVEHVARFAVNPGALPDMTHQYGSQMFRPQFLTVSWADGKLTRIALTGQRVLKSGKLSDKGHNTSRNYDWTSFDFDHPGGRKTPVPDALAARIRAYETAVVTAGGAQ